MYEKQVRLFNWGLSNDNENKTVNKNRSQRYNINRLDIKFVSV